MLSRRTLLAIAAAGFGSRSFAGTPLIVFAAASLKTALDDAIAAWGGDPVTVSYAGTATLARQIAFGAPADLFISANVAWMDDLRAKQLIRAETVQSWLGNALVLIGPAGKAPLAPGDLPEALGTGRLAIGLTRAVPAGIYGKAALENLGLWGAVKDRLAETDNVRAALAIVARGEAPFGLVYASDAAASAAVSVVAHLPADSHPPIRYPAAITTDSSHSAAAPFLAYLASPEAEAFFTDAGFTIRRPPA